MIDSLVWTATTIAMYLVCERIYKRLGQQPWLHPVATSTLLLIGGLLAARIPY